MANKKIFNPIGMPFDTVRDDIADLTTRNASDVVNTPAGDIVATNVQTAINELDTEKVPYTGGTGNVDIGDFELRAQTLESDVATGTAPLTIASTTVNTNLNADLLDGLHDTGFTKTTAGQTINVASAAEITAALALLAAAPSLLGDVIIQLAAGTYATKLVIPTLIYNGFTLTIKGTLTEILSDTSTSGQTVSFAQATGRYGYVRNTGAAYTVNAYQGKLLYNVSTGQYVPIISNDATTIYYAIESGYFTTLGVGDFKVYDYASIIEDTGIGYCIENKPRSITYYEDLSFVTTYFSILFYSDGYVYTGLKRCYFSSSVVSLSGIITITGLSKISVSCVYLNTHTIGFRLEGASTIDMRLGGIVIKLNDISSGYKTGIFLFDRCGGYLGGGTYIDTKDKTIATTIGIWSIDQSNIGYGSFIMKNAKIGFKAQRNGNIYAPATVSWCDNCTAQYDPPAASDPSFITV